MRQSTSWVILLGAGLLVVAAATSAIDASAQAISRCVDATGRVTFTNLPCPGAGPASAPPRRPMIDLHYPDDRPPKAPPSPASVAAERAAALDARTRFCGRSDLQWKVQPGMTEDQFLRCTWPGAEGRHRVNETRTINGTVRQYVFEPGGGTRYVHVRDGIVSSVMD